MVIPSGSDKCCHLKLNVPEGVYTLEHNRGIDNGLMEPGAHWFYFSCCGCRGVKACISMNTIRFCIPINDVPTKDKVSVSLEVGVNFHIGSDPLLLIENPEQLQQDLAKFFYNFGPNRLEELLQEETNEEIRNFISEIRVMRLRDIKTELAYQVCQNLKRKFSPYGVQIEQVNIMSTLIPMDLRHILMNTTACDVQLQHQVQYHKHQMIKLQNDEAKTTLTLKRNNIQALQSLNHDKKVQQIAVENAKIEMQTKHEVQEITALTRRGQLIPEAESKKHLAKRNADAQATKLMQEAKAYEAQRMADADIKAQIIRLQAETRLETAENKTQAQLIESEAREQTNSDLVGKQLHEQKMQWLEKMEKFAPKGKIVLSGDQGEQFMELFGGDHSKAFEDTFDDD